jgi:two-component system, cell cycle sensor histidine kinase and response regulator CckA
VSALIGMLRRLLGERLRVVTDLSPEPARVRADRVQLEQVLMNLAVNARDAMPRGGTLTLATRLARTPIDTAGGVVCHVRLSVTDTGCGMTDEVRSRIFEPFFTTKGPDKGTGLGMATVFGIVQQAGGRIEIDSVLGRGTAFHIDLPHCDTGEGGSAERAMKAVRAGQKSGQNKSVLLVEDEDAVRKLARITLESQGYRVAEAANGEAALGLLARHPSPDLLVTDLTMPGMDGQALAGHVRAAHPGIGVVFVSGYAPESDELDQYHGAIFLPKPFSPIQLSQAAARAVAAAPAVRVPVAQES